MTSWIKPLPRVAAAGFDVLDDGVSGSSLDVSEKLSESRVAVRFPWSYDGAQARFNIPSRVSYTTSSFQGKEEEIGHEAKALTPDVGYSLNNAMTIALFESGEFPGEFDNTATVGSRLVKLDHELFPPSASSQCSVATLLFTVTPDHQS